jgi:hypothetical protein
MFQVMALASGFGAHRELTFALPGSAGFLFLALPNVLLQSQGTSSPEARELFANAPLEDEASILRGSVKALLAQWIGLPALGIFVLQLCIAGPGALPRIVLAFELAAATLIFTRLPDRLTQADRVGAASTANLGIILVMGFGLGILVGVHALLARLAVTLYGGIVALAVVLVLLWRSLDKVGIPRERRLAPDESSSTR